MADPLIARLKTLLVETLRLEDVRPEDIPDDEPLFGSPRFGLDSIDALELVLRLEKEFGEHARSFHSRSAGDKPGGQLKPERGTKSLAGAARGGPGLRPCGWPACSCHAR